MTKYTSEYFTNPDGLKQHYRDYNNAPEGALTVLCMPGLTRNSKDFAGIAEHLSPKYRVICVEQRGRGLSDWDHDPSRYRPDVYVGDMKALIEHLGLDQVIALGTSLGGLMTIMMSAMYPGIFKAAIINDIGPEVDPKGIERIMSYVGKGTPPQTWDEVIEATKLANTGVYPDFTDEEWLAFAKKLYTEVDGIPTVQYDPAIRNNFEGQSDQSAPDLWPVFEATKDFPMVVVRGEVSDILSHETLMKMANTHPNLTPVTVPDTGHVPFLTEPECTAAIDKLLASIS
ncbi:alpha/beta hydrolase [Kordiimonas sp. SCSIO 12603]|uniref:alpha/beta fold hydrolase n=1 Tax=Kordiimonas sp. SCSIO 12603 TaxID=2829596 RepID=UPI0021074D06|nr:alpha/beta hydrolase [Kordiimonas sp. SCSIO 12603]UTW57240.1 alpha/beta hydrolase [Kordiimonas sp. SCSIO 12603]